MSALMPISEDRFWPKVNKNGPIPAHRPDLGPCWAWTAVTRKGYGAVWAGQTMVQAHRMAYVLLVGPVPDGLELDHLCHNGSGCPGGVTCPHRACVNPAHLEPVTSRENLLRGTGPTALNAAKTHCPQGHAYDEANTYRDRAGGRRCRICDFLRNRNARLRKALVA
jgi:HNH endonuclease